MCQECGCGMDGQHAHGSNTKTVHVEQSVMAANDAIAHKVWHGLQEQGVFCVNMMGAPGSGKTTVIEHLAALLGAKNLAVIQGDLESDVDKQRLEAAGIKTYQINTHSGCHLNATMVKDALLNFPLSGKNGDKQYLIIENVGNLVCPAGVQIGQHMNVVVSATTEGSDKPRKYPVIFRDARMIIITKDDLKEAVEFDEQLYMDDLRGINPKAKIFSTTKKSPESFKDVAHFLAHERQHLLHEKHEH